MWEDSKCAPDDVVCLLNEYEAMNNITDRNETQDMMCEPYPECLNEWTGPDPWESDDYLTVLFEADAPEGMWLRKIELDRDLIVLEWTDNHGVEEKMEINLQKDALPLDDDKSIWRASEDKVNQVQYVKVMPKSEMEDMSDISFQMIVEWIETTSVVRELSNDRSCVMVNGMCFDGEHPAFVYNSLSDD